LHYVQGTKITVKVKDLNKNNVLIDAQCDNKECNKILKNMKLNDYKRYAKEDGKYYCQKCAKKLYATENSNKTKLKNGKSFEQWCIENNKQDILDRWDYELNILKPNGILYSTNKKYYFKCPKGIHRSELKLISSFTSNHDGVMDCKQCNSFAQWGIDNIGDNFLEKYWDYDKNIINPWKISYGNSNKNIYIICQEKGYHGSYKIKCNGFTDGVRCGYCTNVKVHPLDSLGTLHPESLIYWSDKNDKSPYEYAPHGSQFVWWKCSNNKHKDYKREICNSNRRNFRCPECDYSKGEESISNYFINKEFIRLSQNDFYLAYNKYNIIYYLPQMKFDNLIGLGNGLLSYDFYIPKLNLLIEYQGEQHERYIPGFHRSKKDFLKQKEHDRRKKEYAQNNNINLLEIWYWDFDNIESILEKELNLIKYN